MNVACPQCKTVFRIDPRKVPAAGVRSRCSVCGGVFEVQPEGQGAVVPEGAGETAEAADRGTSSAPGAPTPAEPEVGRRGPGPEPAPSSPERPRRETEREVGEPSAPDPGPAEPAVGERPDRTETPSTAEPRPEPTEPAQPPKKSPGDEVTRAPSPEAPEPAAAAEEEPEATPAFGRTDPESRSRRLARALISDMVAYHPERQEVALREGRLKELFREEIKKAWREYVDQVGLETAKEKPFFREALNEILARGNAVF